MNCRDSESLILAERDGGLTTSQRTELSDHVAACPACQKFRTNLMLALDAFNAEVSAKAVPDAGEEWRALQSKLHGNDLTDASKRPLAPIFWFGSSMAAAAAIAFALFVTRTVPPAEVSSNELTAPSAPLHDPSMIAGADFVEAGDPNASTLVYVDKESGWLVVWATEAGAETSG